MKELSSYAALGNVQMSMFWKKTKNIIYCQTISKTREQKILIVLKVQREMG